MPSPRRSAALPADPPMDPLSIVRARADALCRAALECCRQHDRAARLHQAAEPELEHEHMDTLCRVCDDSLTSMAEAYTAAAGPVHPARDEPWWHRANALWHASREYARRHAGCDGLGRTLSARHRAEHLGALQMDYELEASALLALRHAAEAYRKARPELA